MKSFKTVFTIIASLSAFGALILGIINYKSNNIISSKQNQISEANLELHIDERSQQYVDRAYNDLWLDSNTANALNEFKNGKIVTDQIVLDKIINEIEGIGAKYCQGTVKGRHINSVLKNTLSLVCDNEIMFTKYGGKKNGTSILCAEYFRGSKFDSILKTENLSTCEFIDSNRFQRGTDNNAKWLIN